MRIKFFLVGLMSSLSLSGHAQTDIYNFADNCIIIPEYEGLYGFVVGASPNKKEAYFILIKKDKKFDATIKIAFNKDREKHAATLIDKNIKIGLFYIGLYMVEGKPTIQKKYFKSTADYQGEYKLFTDGNRTNKIPGGWQRRIMDLYINPKFNISRMRDKNDYRYEQLNFGCSHPGHFGFSGLPIIDASGNVAGIIAQDQKDNESSLYVVDIIAIRDKLLQAGKRDRDECKYFNLVEYRAVNDETICEYNMRLRKEDAKRREYEESLRIQQLKQEDKKNIDEKVKKYGKSSLERVQKRIYNRNIDRPIAFSFMGNASISVMKLKNQTDNSGSASSLDDDSYSYFVGMGIHLSPDRGRVRFTLKPGYAEYGFNIQSGTYGTTASGFDLKKLKIKSYEMPVMMEIVTKRTEKTNNYFGFGYGYGMSRSVTFGFDTQAETNRQQTAMSKSMFYHKILAELGTETTKFRISFFASYQIGQVTAKNYELILSGESIYPFRDIPQGFLVIGVEGAFRLWSQWRNDYKTMFD